MIMQGIPHPFACGTGIFTADGGFCATGSKAVET